VQGVSTPCASGLQFSSTDMISSHWCVTKAWLVQAVLVRSPCIYGRCWCKHHHTANSLSAVQNAYSCYSLHAAPMEALRGCELEKALMLMGQVLLLYCASAAATAAVELEYAQSPGSQLLRCSCVLTGSAPDSMRPCHNASAQLLMAASMEVALTPAAVRASNRPLKMAHEQLSHSSWPLKRS
jgi:hypothetical protein